jgi:hypothetical protein
VDEKKIPIFLKVKAQSSFMNVLNYRVLQIWNGFLADGGFHCDLRKEKKHTSQLILIFLFLFFSDLLLSLSLSPFRFKNL